MLAAAVAPSCPPAAASANTTKSANMSKNDCKHIPERSKPGDPVCSWANCQMLPIAGSDRCNMHHRKKEDLYAFKRLSIANRLQELRKHPDSRNLEIELALIRNILENVVNECDDFVRSSGQIMALVDRISALLQSNIRVGQITGELLSIEEVGNLAQKMVEIVSEYVTVDDLAEVIERFEEVLREEQG